MGSSQNKGRTSTISKSQTSAEAIETKYLYAGSIALMKQGSFSHFSCHLDKISLLHQDMGIPLSIESVTPFYMILKILR